MYLHNTNPKFATGDGIAMAYRAGAEVQDMEFVQFHPTVLAKPGIEGKRFLISESLRGEGAILLNVNGEHFMPKYHKMADLAPRDVVSRSILEEMKKTSSDHVFLSLEKVDRVHIKERFPTIYEGCLSYGIDITKDKIPVSPAAHYAMGGVRIDVNGKTGIPGLFAAGEVSSAGIHGANRLASNSLLDGLVFGHRAAEAAIAHGAGVKSERADLLSWFRREKTRTVKSKFSKKDLEALILDLKTTMWNKVGILRDAKGLNEALSEIAKIKSNLTFTPRNEPEIELSNMALVSELIARAALERTESRGAHYRTDYPAQDDKNWKRHLIYKVGAKQ